MTIQMNEVRPSDSPHIERVTHGRTLIADSTIRPAEVNWHMVVIRHQGKAEIRMVGPWAESGIVTYPGDAEVLWIRLNVGVYMPHMLTRKLLDKETTLPNASNNKFWLGSVAWQFPTYDNADTFMHRLERDELLTMESNVEATLYDAPTDISARTLRHRFLQTTGLSQNHIYQVRRAQQAADLLRAGVTILDAVELAGYYDQPHLTRSLKKFIGYTPAQILTSQAT